MNSTTPSIPTIDTALIPDHVRENIGTTLYKRFMENIRDPETKRRYDELGAAFMKRIGQTEPT